MIVIFLIAAVAVGLSVSTIPIAPLTPEKPAASSIASNPAADARVDVLPDGKVERAGR
jgi:hypothetical protein